MRTVENFNRTLQHDHSLD